MRRHAFLWLLALLFAFPAAAQEQIVKVPGPGGSTLVTRVIKSPGEARQPLVVINHGSPADSSQRTKMEPPRYSALSSWFLARGYVVALPLRRGYGETGGAWAEAYGRCETPDYYSAGLQSAADVQATIDFMRTQPYVAPDRTLVVGQSAGGWATVALSSRNPPGVPAPEAAGRRHRQLHTRSARAGSREVRRHGARAAPLDLRRERQFLRAGPRQAHGRRLRRCRRQGDLPAGRSVRPRRPQPGRQRQRRSDLAAAGPEFPRDAEVVAAECRLRRPICVAT